MFVMYLVNLHEHANSPALGTSHLVEHGAPLAAGSW